MNNNTNPLPDLSGWHPVPDDATVPEGMLIAQRHKDNGDIEVYEAGRWVTYPADRDPGERDYFTPMNPLDRPGPDMEVSRWNVVGMGLIVAVCYAIVLLGIWWGWFR